MQINFPSEVKSSKLGYETLINLFNKCSALKNQYVYLNFKNVSFFEANLCSLLGAILEVLKNNNCIFYIIGTSFKVEEVFSKNGFNKYYMHKPLIADNYGTTVAYKTFENNNDEAFINYVLDELLSKPNFPKMSQELSKRILTNIFETYVNATTHGRCDFVHTCGQFFPSKGNRPLNFTVVDLGINIKENVENHLGFSISATEAIKWAMERKNTTKKNVPGGFGLSEIIQFIKLNKGKLEIVSSNGYYRMLNDHIETYTLPEEFPGTIVNFMFNLSDSKSYSLK